MTSGLETVNIEGPRVVLNGSTPQLVLDCEYDITEYDKNSLVIKWYYNRQPFPVYQWIPNNDPQVGPSCGKCGGVIAGTGCG